MDRLRALRNKGRGRAPAPKIPTTVVNQVNNKDAAVEKAVMNYVTAFRNLQAGSKNPNFYKNGANFKNLNINKPLVLALRSYINARSNFSTAAVGPSQLSLKNVTNAANKAIAAANNASKNLSNIAKLRTAVVNIGPLVETANQMHKQLPNGPNKNAAKVKINQAQNKFGKLKNALNAAEKTAGTGAKPVGPTAVANAAAVAATQAKANQAITFILKAAKPFWGYHGGGILPYTGRNYANNIVKKVPRNMINGINLNALKAALNRSNNASKNANGKKLTSNTLELLYAAAPPAAAPPAAAPPAAAPPAAAANNYSALSANNLLKFNRAQLNTNNKKTQFLAAVNAKISSMGPTNLMRQPLLALRSQI